MAEPWGWRPSPRACWRKRRAHHRRGPGLRGNQSLQFFADAAGIDIGRQRPSSPDVIELALSLSQASAHFTIERLGEADERSVTVTNVGEGSVTLSALDAAGFVMRRRAAGIRSGAGGR